MSRWAANSGFSAITIAGLILTFELNEPSEFNAVWYEDSTGFRSVRYSGREKVGSGYP